VIKFLNHHHADYQQVIYIFNPVMQASKTMNSDSKLQTMEVIKISYHTGGMKVSHQIYSDQ
jgi:mannose/fructose/N-acetylgalactosamine-specific phosphotransferase system component IIB